MGAATGRRRSLLRWLLGARGAASRRRPVRVRRRRLGAVVCLELELEAPAARWGEVATAVSDALVAVLAPGEPATVGRAGIVAGEPPILAAFSARREVVGPLLRDALTAGATHRRPHLWLLLPPGVYLAAAVDPYRPLEPTPESLATIVAAGAARLALVSEAVAGDAGVVLRLVLYGSPGGVRSAFRLVRRALGAPPGRQSASATAQQAPRSALKSRLQR